MVGDFDLCIPFVRIKDILGQNGYSGLAMPFIYRQSNFDNTLMWFRLKRGVFDFR